MAKTGRIRTSVALLLSASLLTLGACGAGGVPAEPSSSQEMSAPESEPATEPVTGPETEPDTEMTVIPPEERVYTVCGTPISEYTAVVYISDVNIHTERKNVTRPVEQTCESVLGFTIPVKLAKGEKILGEKKYDHEILFGAGYRRPGIPEYDPGKIQYGITEDGTVYFLSASPVLSGYLLKEFLREIGNIIPDTGESNGFEVSAFSAEYPLFTEETAKAMGYETVFDDPFDGDELDWNVWKTYSDGPSACGYLSKSQVTVRDGSLVLSGDWLEDGEYGAGWYSGGIGIIQRYCRGYFECTMKCSPCLGRSIDYWSAFWISGYSYGTSNGGPGGAELDIVENFGADYHTSCIWVSGAAEGEGLSNELYECAGMGINAEETHVYGLLWDEDLYRIYVDGVLVLASSYARGTSEIEQIVWLNLCMPNGEISRSHDDHVEMVVEEVKILQKPTE